ncbi:hypothetical protein PQQ51_31580 [Paraburkholderia xenovorans]|uniref:hypothetical protein n=1 Tax=Paraburkholderia xenovorans TaxID=36873 RepID=UPI0038BD9BB5
MQQFDITVQSAGGFTVHAPGRYIKYLSGSNGGGDASLIITPGGQGGSKIVLQPGQAYRVSQNKTTPDSWTLANNAGGATIIGKVVIGDGRIDDNSLQGVVQVVDGGKSRTLAALAFSMVSGMVATPNVYGKVALVNPTGSGARLIVKTVAMADGATAVSSNVVPIAGTLPTTTSGPLPSKLIGPSRGASVGLMQTDATAVAPSTAASFTQLTAPSNSNQAFTFQEPVVILPGYGLCVWSNTMNAQLTATFEWFEEPNV